MTDQTELGPAMRGARSLAARMRMPGAYAFTDDQPVVYKLAANGVDQIVDVEATEAAFAAKGLT